MSTVPGARLTPPAYVWDYGQAISQSLSQALPGISAHVDAVRPSESSGTSQNDRSNGGLPCNMTPPLLCAFALNRGKFCTLPYRHKGPHRDTRDDEPRRMVAVTVALSEPADSTPLDWADTIGAALRLIYRNTTVEIIDTWRTDQ